MKPVRLAASRRRTQGRGPYWPAGRLTDKLGAGAGTGGGPHAGAPEASRRLVAARLATLLRRGLRSLASRFGLSSTRYTRIIQCSLVNTSSKYFSLRG